MEAPGRSAPERAALRRAVAAFVVVLAGLACAAVVAVASDTDVVAWVPGVAAAVAVLVVAWASRSTGRAAPRWRLVVVGLAVWAGGRIAEAQRWASTGEPEPLPDVTDAPILAGLAIVAAALILIGAARTGRIDWIARLDTVITGVAAALVGVVLLSPAVDDADLSGPATWTLAAGGLVVALLVAATLRLAVTRARRLPSGRFLIAGALLLGAGLALAAAGHLELSDADLHRWSAALSAVGALVVAGGALHPTAARMTDRERRTAHELPPPRLLLLAAATAAGPLCAAVQHLRGEDPRVVAVGGGTTLVVVLLALRLELVVRGSRAQAARELVVADLAGALASAGDVPEIRRVTLDAARRLVGPDLSYAAWVHVNERGAMSPIEVLGPHGTVDRATLGVEGALDGLPSPADVPQRRPDSAGRPVVVVPVPCRIAPPAALAVALTERTGDELDDTLAVLGAQAALALDAIVKAAELQERRADARFQQLVRHSTDALVLIGRDGRIRYQSPSVVRVLGYLTVDLDGATLGRVVHPDDADHLASFLDQLIHGAPEAVRTLDVQLLRADGSTIQAEVVGTNLLDNPHLQGVALTIRDVSGRRALEDQLRHQAFHDPLTGLANRALFADRVEHALARIRRSDSPTPAVVFIDLDDFKLVNDSFGHGAGDELLCVVADRLRGCLRSGDTPARLGGDEFAVLLEDAPDVDAIVEVGERILDALHEPITIEGRALSVSGSVGIATRQGPETSPEELLRNADLAMYSAKSSGKGRVELFEAGMHLRAVERLNVAADLEHALERGEITVVYQPIVDLRDRTPVAFEALARWRHPERGPVAPVEFLPVAAQTGAIVPLGRSVIATACRQLATWRAAKPEARWHMSVNLSAPEVLHPDLIPTLLAITAEAGIEPSSLMVELAESTLLTDSEQVLRRLHQLKDAGVQIAIDDFGTGYSSLSYLQRVPFDVLKIDRAFVAALRQEQPAATLVRTILDLSRTLGRVAVAEGIEEQVELDGLLELGCELGQGTLLGAAADPRSLEQALGLSSASA